MSAPNIVLVIYYLNEQQQQQAQQLIDRLKADGVAIVTELSPAPTFFPAEEYHQNYFARNPCTRLLQLCYSAKLMKLQSKFQDLLKAE